MLSHRYVKIEDRGAEIQEARKDMWQYLQSSLQKNKKKQGLADVVVRIRTTGVPYSGRKKLIGDICCTCCFVDGIISQACACLGKRPKTRGMECQDDREYALVT